MEIERAVESGFCTGVRRAIDILERAARDLGPVETLGPVVHNQQVIERLAQSGIRVIESLDHVQGNILAVSSHGVSPQVLEEMRKRGLKVIDTTCPIVRRAQIAARRLADAGFWVIIFGEENHPEVQGALGWAGGKGFATMEVSALGRAPRRVGILSQTTQSFSAFAHFIAQFAQSRLNRLSELRIVNTICDATRRRQQSALELSKRVDLMLVIGGRSSANTRRLAEICSTAGVETYLVEEAEEIDPLWLQYCSRIGVTAGASTPEEAVEAVVARLEQL
ncbi:MAG: 4-hydroxy-3-methylbut-2-enyl diphosphate reductase [Dehalococcoidia bacterium]|nr:4-hydroxy-3-methylbut-2-enyl diphosphate reductase [Chloroflexota bacterium]MCK4241987.1 4-hydroxy-3-methylbut-2-enyl diphosphate reductase [Dehalococcoidia bacterium]